MARGYVRAARPPEAAEIARIQLATWRLAYRRLLPADVLDRLDEAWLTRQWREAIERPPSPRHRVLVALEQAGEDDQPADDGSPADEPAAGHTTLVGFVAAGPADPEAAAPDESAPPDPATTVALTELLVEPRWGRRGHGSRLLAAIVDHWRQDGFPYAVAWVYDQDPATRAFLGSAGWEPDGATRALDVDHLLVPQLRLHTRLDEPD